MHKPNFNLNRSVPVLLIATLLPLFGACTGPKKLATQLGKSYIKPQTEVLEVHGDSVIVQVDCKIPPKTFSRKAVVKFQPVLRYAGYEKPMPAMMLKGDKVKTIYENSKEINYQNGGTFSYYQKVEYTPEMKTAILSVSYNVELVSRYEELNQCVGGSGDTILGTVTTSLSVKRLDDLYKKSGHEAENKDGKGGSKDPKPTTKTVTVYFEINDPELGHHVYAGQDDKEKAERAREEADVKSRNDKELGALKQCLADKKIKIDHVVLRGFASPDGAVERNAELCQQRSHNGEMIVKNEFKNMGVANAYDSAFVSRPDRDDDWNGLKVLVNRSDMTGKEDILRIISSDMDYDSKNAALKKLPNWKYLAENILPILRRTEVVIYGTFPGRDMEAIAAAPFDSLTPNEALNLADNTTDTARKMELYKKYMDKYPQDWAGYNNYASLLLMTGRDKEGFDILTDLHKKYPDNDTIKNNLGVANRYLRNYDAARDLYASAEKGGVKENNNIGILDIKYGKYKEAIDRFEKDKSDYNIALAYCLKGDYDESLKKIESIEAKKANTTNMADVYYLKAIVYARTKDRANMAASLKKAVNLDAKIRRRAMGDLEFRHFSETQEFQDALRSKTAQLGYIPASRNPGWG